MTDNEDVRVIKLKINEIVDYLFYSVGSPDFRMDSDEELPRTIQLNLRGDK